VIRFSEELELLKSIWRLKKFASATAEDARKHPGGIKSCLLPPLLLQPLVENAR